MTFAIIGAGNTGQAIAGYLAIHQEDITLYTRNSSKAERLSKNGLTISGVYRQHVHVPVTTDLEEAIAEARYILITTTSPGHQSTFKAIKPLLKGNQLILILPGYWGAAQCKEELGSLSEEKNILIAETSAMPFVSKADDRGNVHLIKIKQNVQVSCIPTPQSPILPAKIHSTFPQLVPASHIIETSLNNTNVVVHTPITLFNASRIDAADEFRFYGDGVSPHTVKYVEKIDEERRRLADRFNIQTTSILTLLNEFYKTDFTDLETALPGLFPDGKAPRTLDHRYITEDIPYGLVPISELSKRVGLATPYADSVIETAGLLLDRDFRKEGVRFDEYSPEDLSALIQPNVIIQS